MAQGKDMTKIQLEAPQKSEKLTHLAYANYWDGLHLRAMNMPVSPIEIYKNPMNMPHKSHDHASIIRKSQLFCCEQKGYEGFNT